MSEEVTIDDPKAVLDALERAKADAKKYRERLEELQGEMDALQKEKEDLEGVRDSMGAMRDTLRDKKIEEALKLQGISHPARILKYMDKDKVTLTDDYGIEGLDGAVETVKADFPELFDPKRRVGGAADLFAKGENNIQKSTSEVQADKLLGRR